MRGLIVGHLFDSSFLAARAESKRAAKPFILLPLSRKRLLQGSSGKQIARFLPACVLTSEQRSCTPRTPMPLVELIFVLSQFWRSPPPLSPSFCSEVQETARKLGPSHGREFQATYLLPARGCRPQAPTHRRSPSRRSQLQAEFTQRSATPAAPTVRETSHSNTARRLVGASQTATTGVVSHS